jgi:hypothetical protein
VSLGLLSPAYWFLDRRFNPPQGNFLQTYSLQISGIFRVLILLLISAVIIVWFIRIGIRDGLRQSQYLLIVLGLVSTLIGAMPYVVAGHLVDVSAWILNFVPRASDWDSRHQLLLGLGFALIIAGLLGEVEAKFNSRIAAAIVGICVMMNLTYMHAYYLDSLKQNEVIVALSENIELSSSKVIMIDDQAALFNARNRYIRNYEWDAMFASIYADKSVETISGLSYVDCASDLIPDTLLTITATNGRLKATLLRDIGINIGVTKIDPCP